MASQAVRSKQWLNILVKIDATRGGRHLSEYCGGSEEQRRNGAHNYTL